jgi:hypothetical protein
MALRPLLSEGLPIQKSCFLMSGVLPFDGEIIPQKEEEINKARHKFNF